MNNILERLPSSKLESGVFVADKLKDSMLYSFKNGKVRGETTHIEGFDHHFSWKKGEVTGIVGWPQAGKSEFTYFLMFLKSYYCGWKWAVFSPENMSVDHNNNVTAGEIFDTLIHMMYGKGVDPHYSENLITEKEYEYGISFIAKHFFVVYPEDEHTPENINNYLIYLKKKYKVDGWLKDPWNSLDYDAGQREDQWLKRALASENKLAKQNKVCNIITAHPKGEPETDANGLIICPDQYKLSGGTMWNNKLDNVLAINRPYHKINKSDTRVEFHSHKIKKQKLVGTPGMVEAEYNRRTNRYYINGNSPIDSFLKKEDEGFLKNEVLKEIIVPF